MLIPPQPDIALLMLRVITGLILIVHGWPKLKHPQWGNKMGIPTFAGFLVGCGEVFGGLGLLAGFLTPIAGIGVFTPMIGAVYFHKFKWNDPFVSTSGKSYEYALLLALIGIFFLLTGPGAYSIDAILGLA